MQRMRASLACVCFVRHMRAWAGECVTWRWMWVREKSLFVSSSSSSRFRLLRVYLFWQHDGDWDVLRRHHRGGIQMMAGSTAAVCVCVCVWERERESCACLNLVYIHAHCTDVHMCVHHPGNETVFLPRTTNHSQVWQAMKHLSTFNIQPDFFYAFSKAALPPPPPCTRPSDYSSDWKPCEMSDPISSSLCAVRTQAEHEYCRVSAKRWVTDVWRQYFSKRRQNNFCVLQCRMSCSGDDIDNECEAAMALIRAAFEPISVYLQSEVGGVLTPAGGTGCWWLAKGEIAPGHCLVH